MTTTLPPEYLTLNQWERGSTLGINFDTYRALARNALRITESLGATMGIYPLQDQIGCALDIFAAERCITIQINSTLQQLCLLCSHLDSAEPPDCILSVANSPDGWRQLRDTARTILTGDNLSL